ncbi:MAG: histidinol-phosphatase HisJ family protein [Lachnospiraceae bacterium]|nr:histidinol-phosphatase HisJ family protein [Lachnospiraceae bacterium]
MIKADFHVHTSFSSDSDEAMENQVLKGIELGLSTICFTDHMDYDFPKQYEMRFTFDPDKYFELITELKEKYKDKISIRYGIELGLKEGIEDKINALLSSHSFDFIINSTHIVDDLDPYYPEYYGEHGTFKGLLRYYETILKNVSICPDFDVLGHIDYLTRYTPEVKEHKANVNESLILKGDTVTEIKELTTKYAHDYMDIIDEILKKVISLGRGIELNTAGLKYGLGHPHPHIEILKRYKELGGEIITVGSDAHETRHLGGYFDIAANTLKEAGFVYYAEFAKRKPIFHKI